MRIKKAHFDLTLTNSNLHFAEKLCENGNKIDTGKTGPMFGKGKSKCGYQSVHAFRIRTLRVRYSAHVFFTRLL